jgi:hypothetical protein
LEEQQWDDGTLVWSRIVLPNTVGGVLDSDVLSVHPEIPQLEGEAAAFEIITAEEARTRIAEHPDDQMYYFEEQPSNDGRSIWQRIGRNGDHEEGVIMLPLPADNATNLNESTTVEEMARDNDSDEQHEGREQCKLDEDDYAIVESPEDQFVLISDTNK